MDMRLLSAAAVFSAAVAAYAQKAEPEQPRDPSTGSMAPALHVDDADDLLTELEKADAGIRLLHAEVLYDKTFEVAGDRQVRIGELWFVSEPGDPPRRRFAVNFTALYVDQRREEDEQVFVFDGEWLVERQPKRKLMIKRQVVPPGQRFDPLRIGEGPLPIPIGQRRDDIKARFEAVLRPAGDGLAPAADASPEERARAEALAREVEGSTQLRLMPRAGTEQADDFREIRLWYGRDAGGRLLPRMARTVNRSGDVSIVKLINIEVNGPTPAPAALFDVTAPAEGWDVHVMPWRGEAPARSRGCG
jgi:hypothetical protein